LSALTIETKKIEADGISVGGSAAPLFIVGPDTLESDELLDTVTEELLRLRDELGSAFVFKGSYDKANRSSHESYRGPGLERGLEMLARVKERAGLPVTSDVHSVEEVAPAAEVLDIIQLPAFLCRQNDLLVECGKTGRIVNIKKGQFLAPGNVGSRVAAATGASTPGVILTERGTTFGHGDLINDFRSIPEIRSTGVPVCFDATHSVQKPGALGDRSGGNRELVPFLARAAAAVGCDAFFFEVHPNPDEARCDGPNSLRLADLESLLRDLIAIDQIARASERL